MKFPLYIVDAFTLNDQPFTGNPAAVCVLQFDDDISDEQKQKIASQTNLSETAFVAKAWNRGSKTEEKRFTLRWFTPSTEVELCGHATLASAKVIFDMYFKDSKQESQTIDFETKFKGTIDSLSSQHLLTINFPINASEPLDPNLKGIKDIVRITLGPNLSEEVVNEIEYSKTTKKLLLRLKDVSEPEKLIRQISPNFEQLHGINTNDMVRGVIVTSRGRVGVDFLSRYFSPWNGINEDPVTGAAHTVLVSYWQRKFEEMGILSDEFVAQQCSQRGGTLICRIVDQRVHLSGRTRAFLSGYIEI